MSHSPFSVLYTHSSTITGSLIPVKTSTSCFIIFLQFSLLNRISTYKSFQIEGRIVNKNYSNSCNESIGTCPNTNSSNSSRLIGGAWCSSIQRYITYITIYHLWLMHDMSWMQPISMSRGNLIPALIPLNVTLIIRGFNTT